MSENKNVAARFYQILADQQQFQKDVAPLAKRFHRFLLTHQPWNSPMVPSFNVAETKWGDTPVKFKDFDLLFTGTATSNSMVSDPPGLNYFYEIWDYDTEVSQYFCVPFAYFENPNVWEQEALAKTVKPKTEKGK